MLFKDRIEAGKKLVETVAKVVHGQGLVLGIPRGGVVVAKIVAEKLGWPLAVLVTKKIGFPGNPELAMGAVAEIGEPVWDEAMIESYGVSSEQKETGLEEARGKVREYIKKFRNGKRLNVKDKTVIVVDDGIATGRTMEAGIRYLQGFSLKLVLAVPVCARDTADRLRSLVGEWICLHEADNLYAVGQFYREFGQVSDEEVIKLLQ